MQAALEVAHLVPLPHLLRREAHLHLVVRVDVSPGPLLAVPATATA
eukprot:CAMPEP_0180535826 /NCGR_PEP_ID=MMETSP1036_2-20121128/64944_1 /TAXON_ID=632150 /ORGANISM="Azadinium spinosum, Strain 3D9" /LENGTH=45 /DNA_ID= /DNA_START= /DNA_END= /DNA_ORIENTATION=